MRAPASLALALVVALGTWTRSPVGAQVRSVYDLGASGLTNVLQRLQTTASALHTGAHPDDEDSAFLARTARGDHARVAYLALNRGEGGQNIIGTELFDALGVIRTEELLQARRLDGALQFFTRTFDYGFSKTREEATAKWGERETLGDMVRVIRMFRPLVVNSRFSGTPDDGHGQHQLAGYLTPLAFKSAADPSEFPEQAPEGLRPWQAKKLYRGGFRSDAANPNTLEVQTGAFDPVLGRSFAEIAAEGRSQHKSQEMGALELRGPSASGLRLVESRIAASGAERSIFDGIDTSVTGLAALAGLPAGSLRTELQSMADAAARALREYEPLSPAGIIPALATGLTATRSARAALPSVPGSADAKAEAEFLLAFKEADFADALARAAGVVVDPLSNEETVPQGSTANVTVRTFLPDGSTARVTGASVSAPRGWTVATASQSPEESGQRFRREVAAHTASFRVAVPADAAPTQPYFLEEIRRGDVYRWADGAPKALPFGPPLLTGTVTLDVGGVSVRVTRPVQFREADRVRGELRREVNVVPAVTVGLDSRLLVVPLGSTPHQQRVVVRATSFSTGSISGTIGLRLPTGWISTPANAPFTLRTKGEKTSASFVVTAPARRAASRVELTAEATVNGRVYARDVETIAYPHIQTHRVYWPATADVQVLDLKVAPVRVGYVMGSGDEVPEALRRMGVNVSLIDDETLATGDLSTFDTIMVGVRASEGRPEFVANNGRLLQYVERGGTLIVQYQQTDYPMRNLPPYPVKSEGNSRVTDETARVTILAPTHPVFTFPNRIGPADFDGWVQERNLYAFGGLDARYTPLLESTDPGEAPQRGGEVYAELGKGRYVYTAYSWFRQLRAGVPGAYRQIANLVSLSKAPR